MRIPTRLLAIPTCFLAALAIGLTAGCQQQAPPQEGITSEEAQAFIANYLLIWNEGNFDAIGEICRLDYVLHHCALPEDVPGHGPLRDYVTRVRTAFPDQLIKVDKLIAKGSDIVARWTATGTNTGPLGDYPPTGRRMEISGISIFHIENGKAVEEWIVYNVLDVYQQLGYTLAYPEDSVSE